MRSANMSLSGVKPGFFARVFGGAGEVIEPDQKAIIIAVLLGMIVGVLT